jgi:hypothetical protein
VLLRWAVSNDAADGLLLLVTLLMLIIALALMLRWDASNAAADGLLLLVTMLMGQSRCWKCKSRCCCAGLCPMLLVNKLCRNACWHCCW